MQTALTHFDRAVMPSNLLTVQDWCRFMKTVCPRMERWEAAAKRYAMTNGGALVMRADDTLIVFTRLSDGKIRKTCFKSGSWGWAD